jgi:hypothetical protein
MHIIPQNKQEWFGVALVPFKAYTALAVIAVNLYCQNGPRHADYGSVVVRVIYGLFFCFLVLCLGGSVQKGVGTREAYLWTCAFAAADLISILLLLPYLASA